jgi:hypothetical protein
MNTQTKAPGNARPRLRFSFLVCASVVVALAGFLIGPARWVLYSRGNSLPSAETLGLCIWLGWLWIAIFVGASAWYRRRSLWLLLGAPFALWWPFMWIFVSHACSLVGNCR